MKFFQVILNLCMSKLKRKKTYMFQSLAFRLEENEGGIGLKKSLVYGNKVIFFSVWK
jgi:hypothetical protein